MSEVIEVIENFLTNEISPNDLKKQLNKAYYQASMLAMQYANDSGELSNDLIESLYWINRLQEVLDSAI